MHGCVERGVGSACWASGLRLQVWQWVPGLRVQVLGLRSQVSGVAMRTSGLRPPASGLRVRILCLQLRFSFWSTGLKLRISDLRAGFQGSSLEYQVAGPRFREWGWGFGGFGHLFEDGVEELVELAREGLHEVRVDLQTLKMSTAKACGECCGGGDDC